MFEELKAAKPDGVRYLSLRLDDNTFVHFVETETDAQYPSGLAAFKAFQNGIRERCIEPPVASGVTIVGNYRMLDAVAISHGFSIAGRQHEIGP